MDSDNKQGQKQICLQNWSLCNQVYFKKQTNATDSTYSDTLTRGCLFRHILNAMFAYPSYKPT